MNKLKNLMLAALLGVCAQAYAGPTLSVAATPNPVAVGATGNLSVMIDDIADLYAYQFTLTFDASLLEITGLSEGAFLGRAGGTLGDPGVIDNAAGTVSFVYNSLVGPIAGASGSGSLASFTFKALGAGNSSLLFSDVLFLDSSLNDIAVTATAGTVGLGATAIPEPGTFLLFGAALAMAGAMRRRQLAVRG